MGGEHGELAAPPLRAAFGAVRIGGAHPEELLEVVSALHAHELVERPRHKSRCDGGWAVKPEGQERPVSTHLTQAEAKQAAKSRAREHGDPEVVIHKADGRICDRDTMDLAHEGREHDNIR